MKGIAKLIRENVIEEFTNYCYALCDFFVPLSLGGKANSLNFGHRDTKVSQSKIILPRINA